MNFTFRESVIIFATLTLIHISCYRDAIDLDLDGIGSQVVIEGIVTDQQDVHTVKISKPVNFTQAGESLPISGADVMITDDLGNSETLQETQAGQYRTHNIQGSPGRTYTLMAYIQGQKYTAISTMPEAIELDSIEISPIYGTVNDINCYFTDPAGVENFCRLKVFQNGELVYTFLYQDRYSDGQQIVIDDIETNFNRGDHVEIQFMTISKSIFEYFETINDASQVTLVTLYNPKSNISNNALGYFSAQTLRRYSFVVQ